MYKRKFVPVLMAALLSCAVTSVAAEAPKYEVGGGISYFVFEDDFTSVMPEDDIGFRGYGGMRLGEHWGVELTYDALSTETAFVNTDMDIDQYYISGLYHFAIDRAVQPYLSLGWGEGSFEIEQTGDSNESTATNFGMGFKWYMAKNWILRPSLNYFINTEFDENHMTYGLTLSYAWGGLVSTPVQRPVTKVKDTDNDKDGVTDSADRCPNTPPGVMVDAMGCVPNRDSDGDGVYDVSDKCPNTVAKLKVDTSGCPITLSETVSIDLKVNFDSNSDAVKPEYFSEIRKVASFLAQYKGTVVEIEGHTDSSGAAAYNKNLSQRRADAVARVLVEQMGVSGSRVTAKGYGEERPVASEETREGRLANRRVVATVSTDIEKMIEEQ